MKKTLIFIGIISIATLALIFSACGGPNTTTAPAGKSIATGSAGNNLTATITAPDGSFKKGPQEFILVFTDASAKPVDVGSVAFNLHMPSMGSMAPMNNSAVLTTTGTPGAYKGKVAVEMPGEWQAQITYEGPAGKGSFALPINAK
jgi:YtkA-like